ncbi:hypothetical protein FJT64_000298 [Amphibalanus amphitrite]|uniref:Uncharacterized protein n=1 Tax=Amphibalanus amphitrite TaxID=1232801 RepID=A0A6A4WEI2_AMPAM|nr:hypothetical protein FJT64_000298 [Amphibalanus amphitrite]
MATTFRLIPTVTETTTASARLPRPSRRFPTGSWLTTQTRVVSQPLVQFVTSTVISSQVVPSVIVRTSVFRSTVVVPQEVVRTSNVVRFVTRTVQVPGAVRQVVRTSEQVVRSTVIRQLTTTLETTQLRTSVQFRTPDETIFVTSTQIVPQVKTIDVTSTELFERTSTDLHFAAGGACTSVNTQYVDSRIVKTQQIQVTNTDIRVNTNFVTVTEPAREVVSVVVQDRREHIDSRTDFRTQLVTKVNTQQVVSTVRLPDQFSTVIRTVVRTQVNTEFKTQTQRRWCLSRSVSPDTFVTVTSVNVVPVTSIVYRSRVVPQYVTSTKNVANTVTRTEATTQLVPVRSTIVQNVVSPRFVTDYVTDTQRVVRNREVVQVASTVRGADTYNTQIVTVPDAA